MNRIIQACAALVLVGGLFSASSVSAQTMIISDSFSGTNGTGVNGRTPDGADLPGRNWGTATNYGGGVMQPIINGSAGNPAPSAFTGFNADTAIDISSNGGYSKPSSLTLSLDLKMNTIQDGSPSVRGIGLGFFSLLSAGAEASQNFTGLTVRPDGSLHLVVNGTQQSASVSTFSGFSVNNFYTLSYTIDTITGTITQVIFNGYDDTSAFSGAVSAGVFTPSATNLAGYYGNTANDSAFTGIVDNLSVTAIPEPSTYVSLLGLAALGFAAYCRRHRQAG